MAPWVSFAILSALCASLVSIFGKIGLKNIDSTLGTTLRSLFMSGFLLLTSFSIGAWSNAETVDKKALLFIALSGIAGATSWLFYFWSLKHGPAGSVAALDRLSIVFVVILAAFFLGEGITWKTALGSLLILGGATLFVFK